MTKTDVKNDLSSAVTKEQIFAFVDAYFAEGQADISFDITADDVRKHLRGELELLKATGQTVATIAELAQQANANARNALEMANRKSGGTFTVKIERADAPTVTVKNPHKQFAELLTVVSTGCHAFLAGPAGSGKTTAAEQAAKALGLDFYFTGAIATEYKLTGFIDAQGRIISTDFRRAYEKGGVFLFDEIDASLAPAVLAFNAALSNGYMDFPDKRVTRHENFVAIAAGNTYGQGADRVYVGRNQLDAASLDRFVFIGWDYDEELETRIAGNAEWSRRVQQIRRAVESLKIRAVVSPRASIHGARLLARGLDQDRVETLTIWKGIDSATVSKIRASLR